jgi:hypothetical protein
MLRSLEHALLSPFDFVDMDSLALFSLLRSCFLFLYISVPSFFSFVRSGAASMMIHSTHTQPVEAGQPSQLAHMGGSTLVTCWSP